MRVYLTTVDAKDPVRDGMFILTAQRWKAEEDAQLEIITPDTVGCSVSDFQRERRVWADSQEKVRLKASEGRYGRFHCVSDDDCLLQPGAVLDEAEDLLKEYHEFAMLSLMPANAVIHSWRPKGYEPFEDRWVMEHYSVGGVRLCRTGCLEEWPRLAGPGYDGDHCVALRNAGWRVGYLKQHSMLHLGEGYSTVWA